MEAPSGPPEGQTSSQLRDRVDEALEKLLARPEYASVYAGPWWGGSEGVERSAASDPLSWKRAVLRRRDSGGAEHWGHLFLVLAKVDGNSPSIVALSLGGLPRRTPGEVRSHSLDRGRVTLLARPVMPDAQAQIYRLAEEIAVLVRDE